MLNIKVEAVTGNGRELVEYCQSLVKLTLPSEDGSLQDGGLAVREVKIKYDYTCNLGGYPTVANVELTLRS